MSAATDALSALRSAVDALLAAPDAFDGDDELHAFVIGAQVEQHRLVAAVAPAVARWDSLRLWADDGRTDQFNARVGCQPHNRNHTKRDRDPQPHPQQPVDRLAALRAKCRWVYRRECERNGDDSDGSGSR